MMSVFVEKGNVFGETAMATIGGAGWTGWRIGEKDTFVTVGPRPGGGPSVRKVFAVERIDALDVAKREIRRRDRREAAKR